VTVLAAIRPDSWNLPLLLHVLGAMVLVGGLALAVTALLATWRGGEVALARLGFRALLLAALPGGVLMRAGAAWIGSKEHLNDSNVTWIGIGFTTADGGLPLLIIAIVLAGLAVRRARRPQGGGRILYRVAALLASLLLAAYLVTVWAMTAKPT